MPYRHIGRAPGRNIGASGGRRACSFALLLPALVLLASCTSFPVLFSSPTPAATSTPLPTPTSTPLPSSTPSPTPSPAPTVDPAAVAALVASGRARLAAQGVLPLCLRWEDTDGDGEAEWLGLAHQPGEPARLAAFVLDGEAWHDLLPLAGESHGLGEHPTCEMEVRDINVDGRVELLVWGRADASTGLLHVFAWDGSSYALLAPFEGEAGVWLENLDGDLADEIVVGYHAGSDLVWKAVYTWNGSGYGWTWERYGWFYLDRPHVCPTDTPVHAVICFYLAVDDRDLPGAYGLLSPAAQAAQPAGSWMAGYVTTVAAEVGAVYEIDRSGDTATVVCQVRAYDNVDGRIFASLWDVEWAVVRTDAGWRLDRASATQLDRWEAAYYE